MKRKYPTTLFLHGFATNIVFHYLFLFAPAVILIVIGIFFKTPLRIGLIILALDIVLSFVEQMRIRAAFTEDSDNEDFRRFQDALSQDGDWRENTRNVLDELMNKHKD